MAAPTPGTGCRPDSSTGRGRDAPASRPDAPGKRIYASVLSDHFDQFYVTEHHAGSHPHAHAIAFSDRRLDADQLGDMREHLQQLEAERERELDRSHDWSL